MMASKKSLTQGEPVVGPCLVRGANCDGPTVLDLPQAGKQRNQFATADVATREQPCSGKGKTISIEV